MNDTKLSKHLSLREALRSETAKRLHIDNSPTPEHLENMIALAEAIFEPCRTFVGRPLAVNSLYRSQALNKAIKGASATSDHCRGAAIDMDCDIYGGSNREMFFFIVDNLDFGQLIWEFGEDPEVQGGEPSWVHCSYYIDRPNKKQVLQAYKVNGRTRYKTWEDPRG
jgi:hypothetical protein